MITRMKSRTRTKRILLMNAMNQVCVLRSSMLPNPSKPGFAKITLTMLSGSILNVVGAEKGPLPNLVKATALITYTCWRVRFVKVIEVVVALILSSEWTTD